MIACISPGSSSADHSINTLRYADRLKDRSGAPPIKPMKYEAPDEIEAVIEESKELDQKPTKMDANPSKNNLKPPVEEKNEPRKPPVKIPQPSKQYR